MAVSMQLLSVGKFAICRKIVCEFEKSIPELFHLKSKASLVETTTTTKKTPEHQQTNKQNPKFCILQDHNNDK